MLKFTNILHPINLDSKDIQNVKLVLEFAQTYKSKVHFFYVNDEAAGYRHPTEFQDSVALRIKEEIPAELLESADIVYAVSKGDLDDEVQKYCKENPIDLIITNHKHHSKFYSSLFDTPDENIIDSVNIPVLLLPKN